MRDGSRMGNELLSGYPVVVTQAVVWGDMDSYRHVNNTVYFRYFENARLEYFRRMRWFEYEEQTGIGPILSATDCRFRKALTYPDTISIGARVSSIGADRCIYDYLIVSHGLDAVAAEGHGIIVSYDYRKGMKVPFPEELRRRIEELESRKLTS
jgi:acyl-CoA thioester hydrolase